MGTMGCHTKQMRLRGVLGMGRLRVRRCHRRRAEWCREFYGYRGEHDSGDGSC
ncbi:hypothetical protein J008_04216 [Cryptococcus neoformans]|nr:hypothetical protein C365_06115 [Cryptococcus neoformans var. grubii Bt85]OXG79560.1 hypothetical protein C349_04367 [Cryptococcus neoformans var. grubii Br795]OXH29673.1 hypothetical protein J008_04216 [Cryptococcus neoformans var. grubii]OXL07185.1 hypothetical protein C348_04468 [Cryptococcus neoformans var. grubii Gb118]